MAGKIAEQLLSRGHQVFVVTCGMENLKEIVNGTSVYRLSPANIFAFHDINKKPLWLRVFWHFIDQNNLFQASRVRKIIEQEKPDLILSHNLKGLGYQVLREISRLKIPIIHTLHDVQLAVPSGLIISGRERNLLVSNPLNTLFSWRNQLLFDVPATFISPSAWLADFYKERGFFASREVRILRNPVVSPDFFNPKIFSGTYLYLGQLEEHKGIKMLLESFSIFARQHPEVLLEIVGTGSLEAELREQYKDHPWLRFRGYVPYNELEEKVFGGICYTVAQTLCYENFPGSVMDSLASGIPVIAAEIGGTAEMVSEGMNGFEFTAGNKESLIEALERSWDSQGDFEKMQHAARQTVAYLNYEHYIEQIFKIGKL